MSEDKRILELDEYEHRAVVNIINDKRTEMISKNEDTDFINEIFEKIIYAPTKKKVLFKKDNRDER